MDKMEQKFKKYLITNKILAILFMTIFVSSLVLFFTCIFVHYPEWLMYIIALSPIIILPVSFFLATYGFDLCYFKKIKLEIFDNIKNYYESQLDDEDITKIENYQLWEDFYHKINLEKLKKDAINQTKQDFCKTRFNKFEELKKYDNHIKIYQKLINTRLVDSIVEKYNEDLIVMLKELYPQFIKNTFYPQEYSIVEKIILSFLNGNNFLSKESIWGFSYFDTKDNYPGKPIEINFEFFKEKYLNKTVYYSTNEKKLYIPTKVDIDTLEKEKEYCIKSTESNLATKQRTQSLASTYNTYLEKYWLTDSRQISLGLPKNLEDRIEEKPQQINCRYVKNSFRYINHCWNCGTHIDEDWYRSSVKCPKCGYFKCRKCGKCFCDDNN